MRNDKAREYFKSKNLTYNDGKLNIPIWVMSLSLRPRGGNYRVWMDVLPI